MALEVSLAATPHRRLFAHFPWHIFLLSMAISAVGVWNLASAAGEAHASVWISQAWWMGFGVVLALAISLVDYRNFQRLAWVFYALVLGLLVLVHFKGRSAMGAQRWLQIGPMNLQPSELAKVAVALVLASFFAADADKRREGYGLLQMVIPLGVTMLPAALILKQPDLGTALIVVAVGCTQLMFAKVRWVAVAILLVVAVIGGAVAFRHLKGYQRDRINCFINPTADAKGACYHITQSFIAVGSGQGTGKGWNQGTQTRMAFLPEQHTDFIFSVWAEEHGFVGCLLVLILYFALLASAVDVAGAARDRFGQFLAIGLTGMLFWHVFINVGMVIGLLPVVGVTLPFMSYGGSSVLAVYTAVGLLANVSMRRFVN